MLADRHGWNKLDHYLSIHDACLRDFGQFIEANSLSFSVTGPSTIVLEGRLTCLGVMFLSVRQTLELNDRNHVRTIRYAYQAGPTRPVERKLFRYDNALTYVREGHADAHHKHRFDQ